MALPILFAACQPFKWPVRKGLRTRCNREQERKESRK